MTDSRSYLAIFADIDPASYALDRLRELGLSDEQMNVISGIPVTEAMLGRPRQWTNVPRLALGGAVGGFLLGAFLAFVAPVMYPIHVGGQGILPGAPSVVVLFELTMLGMLAATFLGIFLDSRYPSYTPKEYVPEISDGRIAILFECPAEKENKFIEAMQAIGAESVKPAEAQKL
jgi:hypothetical protein